ncbi:helix-turn-helix domain-containing protein [Streptomyces sp. URMC 129]|uniref:helix-turn-helix domain-containing protein n=1 Tax=Streptomyces sp. URMC 129 TaxID=3423407 RepID=UPI003F1DF062
MTVDPGQAGQDRKDLAEALKALRIASGLSGERLAVRCGISQSKVSRIETGRTLPTVVDVQLMLKALGVDDETADDLVSLARRANTEYEDVRSWARKGLHTVQQELTSLEAKATRLRYFLPAIPTGLLQTPEYMRVAMSPAVDLVKVDVSRAIALKLRRQAILHDDSKRFEFLLTESALRWRLAPPGVMALQLDRIASLSRLPNVWIGVLPLSRTIPEMPFHTFTVYDRTLLTIEVFSGRIVLRDPKDIDYYGALFDFFQRHAESGPAARRLLEGWADEFRTEAGGE